MAQVEGDPARLGSQRPPDQRDGCPETLTLESLLLEELKIFSNSFWQNEALGEKRVNFFLMLTTAVISALVTLYEVTADSTETTQTVGIIPVRSIALFALLGLLAFGLVTQLRMVRRNCVTEQYKKAMDQIRDRFRAQSRTTYVPFPEGSKPTVTRGGLADMVAVIDGVIVAGIVYMAIAPSDPSNSTLSVQASWAALIAGVVSTVGLIYWAQRKRDEYKDKLKTAYAHLRPHGDAAERKP